ncbi:multidrug ABC transporter ATP-binding protein [Phycicoccus endophyticus]|nr:multidrug ABC transporter ATP-binding protein [Phycicoccus endophyticus]
MPLVEVTELCVSHGDLEAVAGVSLTVEQGEIHGVLGPNGAGKTSTVETVAGLRRPDSGSVRVAGIDPAADRRAATRLVGVQLQEAQLQPKLRVGEALALWSALYADPVPWRELAGRLGLEGLLGRRFDRLSGGQRQRLSIALALLGRPTLVILDELTTGLDPEARRDTWQIVRETRDRGTTVLLVTHSMEEAQLLCDRVTVIVGGRVRATGTPRELVGGADATVMAFTPEPALDPTELSAVAGVAAVRCEDGRVLVTGSDEAVLLVLERLHARGVRPGRLRVSDGSLDQAYLDLVRRPETARPEERR